MNKTEILEEPPKLTKTERQEIRLRLVKLDNEDWLDDEDPLTVHEQLLLKTRFVAYAEDPNAVAPRQNFRTQPEPALIAKHG